MAMGKKGEAQRLRIIESASYCLTNFGERGATFQAIAEHCQMSQASVVKYLKSRDNIFAEVLNHWIARARRTTEESLANSGSPEEKLRNYIRISVEIFSASKDFRHIYLMLHYFASIDERYRVINTEIKTVARERVAGILQAGVSDGSFRKIDIPLTAKTIHNSLVGYLISSITEISKPSDLQLPRELEAACVALVIN
jgi:AcrR family transcriptional regulator